VAISCFLQKNPKDLRQIFEKKYFFVLIFYSFVQLCTKKFSKPKTLNVVTNVKPYEKDQTTFFLARLFGSGQPASSG
jgi:hypothetical protein